MWMWECACGCGCGYGFWTVWLGSVVSLDLQVVRDQRARVTAGKQRICLPLDLHWHLQCTHTLAHTHTHWYIFPADTTHQAQGSRVPPMWGMEMRFRMRMTENLSHTDDDEAFHLGIRSRQFYIYGFRGVCPVCVCVCDCVL